MDPIDLDQRPVDHHPGARNVGERGRCARVREMLPPHPDEPAVIAARLDQVHPHVMAMRPVGVVRLQLFGQHLEDETGLLLDVREMVGQPGRGLMDVLEIRTGDLSGEETPRTRLDRRREVDPAPLHWMPAKALHRGLFHMRGIGNEHGQIGDEMRAGDD
jgi:hypothetical protein